jgi:hypothetical protein
MSVLLARSYTSAASSTFLWPRVPGPEEIANQMIVAISHPLNESSFAEAILLPNENQRGNYARHDRRNEHQRNEYD